jgi:hypothetical protein
MRPSPALHLRAAASGSSSPARAPSTVSRRQPSTRRTGYASGSTSARRSAAHGKRQRRPCPKPASDRPARACARPVPGCVVSSSSSLSSLPAQSLGGKTLTRPGSTKRGQAMMTQVANALRVPTMGQSEVPGPPGGPGAATRKCFPSVRVWNLGDRSTRPIDL